MKWMVAGAGALLSLAGAYALITGSSIVQVERGWSMVIAGSVIFAAGAVLLGMAAVMAKMEKLARTYLAASASTVTRPSSSPAPEEAASAEDEPPARRRFARAPASPESAAPDTPPAPLEAAIEPPPAPAPAPVAESEPAGSPGLRDFQFVFPPAEAEREPQPAPARPATPAPETYARVEPLRPPRPAPSPAASRFANQWLRRNKDTAIAPSAPVEALSAPEPEPEPQPEPEIRAPAEEPTVYAMAESNVLELRVDALAPPELEAPSAMSIESEPPAAVEPDADPFSPDWLERAIAAGEADAEAAVTHPQEAERAPEESAASLPPESEPAAEAATDASESAPAASGEPLEAVERTATPAPVEIGRYKANDVAYVMYADGSITAETPAGASYRFSSLLELRKFIEKGGA